MVLGGVQSSMFYVASKYIHAEDMCIRNCNKSIIKDSYMIVVRLNQSKEIIDCESCDSCKKKIYKYKIKKVYLSRENKNYN